MVSQKDLSKIYTRQERGHGTLAEASRLLRAERAARLSSTSNRANAVQGRAFDAWMVADARRRNYRRKQVDRDNVVFESLRQRIPPLPIREVFGYLGRPFASKFQ